ncbi:hypothetical protein DFH07DRAFT_778502 [Mycena maculata]|uniref:Uncharacterized protein n=1 Tax=Mycena maculata TaxID=230809 RepID=A0AAD7ID00_9AGAR|nr:hypothetical protein DFH07DRAFT_778502 [Mycena maculata]
MLMISGVRWARIGVATPGHTYFPIERIPPLICPRSVATPRQPRPDLSCDITDLGRDHSRQYLALLYPSYPIQPFRTGNPTPTLKPEFNHLTSPPPSPPLRAPFLLSIRSTSLTDLGPGSTPNTKIEPSDSDREIQHPAYHVRMRRDVARVNNTKGLVIMDGHTDPVDYFSWASPSLCMVWGIEIGLLNLTPLAKRSPFLGDYFSFLSSPVFHFGQPERRQHTGIHE